MTISENGGSGMVASGMASTTGSAIADGAGPATGAGTATMEKPGMVSVTAGADDLGMPRGDAPETTAGLVPGTPVPQNLSLHGLPSQDLLFQTPPPRSCAPLCIKASGTVFASIPGTDRQSCAFPQVAVLPGGRWLAGCRAAPSKGGTEGQHVLFSTSDDGGTTWSEARSPFAAPVLDGKPGQFRALALTALGGERVLATLYWVDHTDPALPFYNETTGGLLDSKIMVSESADGGESWSELRLMDTAPFDLPTPITGPVLLLPDGALACQFETNKHYFDESPWVHRSVLMFSRDGGRSWPEHCVVTRDPRIFYWDQRPRVLPDGRILDLFWTYDTASAVYLNIHASWSDDGGHSWSALRDTGVAGQPAPAAPLPDGSLAMAYVDREGAPAIRCRRSVDGGFSWPEESVLTLYESVLPGQTLRKDGMADAWSEMGKFSVGLPQTASTQEGDLLVLHYAGPSTDVTSVLWTRIGP